MADDFWKGLAVGMMTIVGGGIIAIIVYEFWVMGDHRRGWPPY